MVLNSESGIVNSEINAFSSDPFFGVQILDNRYEKSPGVVRLQGFLNGEPGNVLLSLEIQPTIIGAKAFHCPVRNGKEWLWSPG